MPPSKPPPPPRWVWIPAPDGDGRLLAYVYEDKVAGPSAKGAKVGDPPTAEEVLRAVEQPDRTVREPKKFGAVIIKPAEVLRLGLPKDPPWLGHFNSRRVGLRRGEPSRTVTGRVVQGETPVAGIRVRLGLAYSPDFIEIDETHSDTAGKFEFSLAPMRTIAAIAATQHASSRFVPVTDNNHVELALMQVGRMVGEVWRGGLPATAHISVYGQDGASHRVTHTKPPGQYTIDGLIPGRYAVHVEALDANHRPNGTCVIVQATVDEAATTTVPAITLEVGATVHIVVRVAHKDDGASIYLIAGARSFYVNTDVYTLLRDPVLRSANSMTMHGDRITTQFHDVRPGVHTLCVIPSDYSGRAAKEQPVAYEIVVVDGDDQTVEIVRPPITHTP